MQKNFTILSDGDTLPWLCTVCKTAVVYKGFWKPGDRPQPCDASCNLLTCHGRMQPQKESILDTALKARAADELPGMVLPTDPKERKAIPLCTGVIDYFAGALAEIAKLSKAGNDQHNPGQPLHWARDKSQDHSDTIARHLVDRGLFDTDGQRHSAKLAWRALALLQVELEEAGAVRPRGGK